MMLRLAAIVGLAGAGLVTLDGGRAHAQAAYRATDISLRLYTASQLYPIELNDAGQVATEEWNSNQYRGFIAQRIFTPTTPNGDVGAIQLLDHVVGEIPLSMPAGLVGYVRLRRLTDGGRISYTGGRRGSLYEPASPATPAVGSTLPLSPFGFAFNDARLFAAGDEGSLATTVGLYELGTTDAAPLGRRIASADLGFDATGAPARPRTNLMNAGGVVLGFHETLDGTRETIRPFRWTPDLTGQTEGKLERLGPVFPRRFMDDATFLNDAGAAIVAFSAGAAAAWTATIYAPDGATTDLNALLGAPSVQVLDFDDRGRVLAQLAALDGSDRRTVLYDPATFDAGVGIAPFDDAAAIAALGPDAVSFRPMEINTAGQLAGLATFRRLGAGGSVTTETSAVLLTPVPEPAAIAGVAGIVVALACRRRPGSRYSRQP